jgi:hypothetical protein
MEKVKEKLFVEEMELALGLSQIKISQDSCQSPVNLVVYIFYNFVVFFILILSFFMVLVLCGLSFPVLFLLRQEFL